MFINISKKIINSLKLNRNKNVFGVAQDKNLQLKKPMFIQILKNIKKEMFQEKEKEKLRIKFIENIEKVRNLKQGVLMEVFYRQIIDHIGKKRMCYDVIQLIKQQGQQIINFPYLLVELNLIELDHKRDKSPQLLVKQTYNILELMESQQQISKYRVLVHKKYGDCIRQKLPKLALSYYKKSQVELKQMLLKLTQRKKQLQESIQMNEIIGNMIQELSLIHLQCGKLDEKKSSEYLRKAQQNYELLPQLKLNNVVYFTIKKQLILKQIENNDKPLHLIRQSLSNLDKTIQQSLTNPEHKLHKISLLYQLKYHLFILNPQNPINQSSIKQYLQLIKSQILNQQDDIDQSQKIQTALNQINSKLFLR